MMMGRIFEKGEKTMSRQDGVEGTRKRICFPKVLGDDAIGLLSQALDHSLEALYAALPYTFKLV